MPYTNQKHDTEQIEGAVKWFDPKKGFGFIVGPDGQDVFVHFSQIVVEGFKTLQDDQRVTYELVEGDKGYQAQGVRPVVDPEEAIG
ncbi:MAG: cold-shock protein [Planctomycetota bacterium]